MKYLLSLVCFQFIILNSVYAQKDSIKRNKNAFIIECGLHKPIFLNKDSRNFSFRKNTYDQLQNIVFQHLIGITYLRKNKFFISTRYTLYQKRLVINGLKERDLVYYAYSNIDVLIGKSFSTKICTIEPSITIHHKHNGFQTVLIRNSSNNYSDPLAVRYLLKSKGLGASVNFRKYIVGGFNISTEISYAHYFETNKLDDERYESYENFFDTYRVNRDFLNVSLKIGYTFNRK